MTQDLLAALCDIFIWEFDSRMIDFVQAPMS